MSNFWAEYEAGTYTVYESTFVGIVEGQNHFTEKRTRCHTDDYVAAVGMLAALRCCEGRYDSKRYTDAYNKALDDVPRSALHEVDVFDCRYCNQSFNPAGGAGMVVAGKATCAGCVWEYYPDSAEFLSLNKP